MPLLEINLLGIPSLRIDKKPVFQENSVKAQALLYYLVTTGRTHYRNELASLFWSDMPDAQALKNLRNVLPVLRVYAGAHVVVTRQTVTFNRYTPYWLDVEAFEDRLGVDPSRASTEALWEAVDLYNDDFLTGFYVRNALLFEEWMLLKRERLRDILIDALQTLAQRHLQQQDYQATLNATKRLLSIEPWRESGHQQQMHALLGLGQRNAALAQYHTCCRILVAEFGVLPNAETTALYEQIKTPTYRTMTDTHVAPISVDRLPIARSVGGRLEVDLLEPDFFRLEHTVTKMRLPWLSNCNVAITVLSPDGRLIAGACTDHSIRLWDTIDGGLCATLLNHNAAITALSFSPDGCILASATADYKVQLWDTTSGTLSSTLQGHTHPVVDVVFSADGTRLISIDTDHVVLFWSLQPLHSVNGHSHALSTNDERLR